MSEEPYEIEEVGEEAYEIEKYGGKESGVVNEAREYEWGEVEYEYELPPWWIGVVPSWAMPITIASILLISIGLAVKLSPTALAFMSSIPVLAQITEVLPIISLPVCLVVGLAMLGVVVYVIIKKMFFEVIEI